MKPTLNQDPNNLNQGAPPMPSSTPAPNQNMAASPSPSPAIPQPLSRPVQSSTTSTHSFIMHDRLNNLTLLLGMVILLILSMLLLALETGFWHKLLKVSLLSSILLHFWAIGLEMKYGVDPSNANNSHQVPSALKTVHTTVGMVRMATVTIGILVFVCLVFAG